MNKEKYQQLKEIIQKANPEIMELKFGCEYERKNEKYKYHDQIISQNTNNLHNFYNEYYEQDSTGKNIGYIKNLGRPIRLADVLSTLLKKEKDVIVDCAGFFCNQEKFKEINESKHFGEFFNAAIELREWDLKNHWKLKDDNLDNQSDETKEFLINLLVK